MAALADTPSSVTTLDSMMAGRRTPVHKRTCIYTAIFGGYDSLLQPVPQTVPCDFVCFTDADLPARLGAWTIVRSNLYPAMHPRLRAKYFKIMSHEVFPGDRLAWRFSKLRPRPRYDRLVWIDGCLQITSPQFAAEAGAHVGPTGWSLFIHPDRDCIYEEAAVSMPMAKYAGLRLLEQVDSYRRQGFPPHAGLYAGGLIVRNPHHAPLHALNAAWWAENLRWSYQDQLSLPLVLRRLGLSVDPVRLNLWDNPWFARLPHHGEG